MAIPESDTPPLPSRIICHRNGTPFRNVVHMVIQDTHTSPSRAVSEAATRELRYRGWWVVVMGVVVVVVGGELTRHAHKKTEREREGVTERERQAGG